MKRTRPILTRNGALLALLIALALAHTACREGGIPLKGDADWRIYAIQYGLTPDMSHNTMVRTASKDERIPMGWYAFLLMNRDGSRKVLVDTGFKDEPLRKQWRVTQYRPVDEILTRLSIAPSDITDVIVTHSHWDHMGRLSPYSKATVWIQAEELAWASSRVDAEKPNRGGVRLEDVNELKRMDAEKRLNTVEDGQEFLPGVIGHKGGKHTGAIQWLEIRTASDAGTIVLASDMAYLFENIEKQTASRSTHNAEADEAQLKKMRETASALKFVIPAHDPQILKRFPNVTPHVAEIK